MIRLKKDSTNYLRAQVTDETGAQVNDATVTCTVKRTYGGAVPGLEEVTLAPTVGHADYNYEYLIANTATCCKAAVIYQAIATITRNGHTVKHTETLEVYE